MRLPFLLAPRNIAGLAGLTLAYGLGVALFATAAVSARAWVVLYAACVAAAFLIWARWPVAMRPATWLVVAFYAGLVAAIFAGADFALDALNGPRRNVGSVAQSLGGLELGFVLCPGVVSVALGTWLRQACP